MPTGRRYTPWLSGMGPESGDLVLVTPESSGWERAGLHVLRLEPGQMRTIATGDFEAFVLPLAGGLTLEVSDATRPGSTVARFGLAGRGSVFDRVSDFAYAGRDSLLRLISANGAEVALPMARCDERLEPALCPVERVPVRVQGAGPSTRQVTPFGVPGVWDHAERLTAYEVLSPGGNWSEYPPHKHDVTGPEAQEEITFFKVSGPDRLSPSREGFALYRAFTTLEHEMAGLPEFEDTLHVRDGDAYAVPYGFHGPAVAAPGYDLYHLHVLAGDTRAMTATDDPAHAWVRDEWVGQAPDPRVPITTGDGRSDGQHPPTGSLPVLP